MDAAKNRLGVPAGQAGVMHYDAAGNLDNDTYTSFGSRTYDYENRMVTAFDSGGQSIYTYDADGRRVRRQTGGQTTWQVYGIEGELVAEYAAGVAPSAPQQEYGYRNGELLITASASAPAPGVNLALGKAATQSSDLYGQVASHAVDGNTTSTMTHTNLDNQAWWQVDLGSVQSIQTIKVYNRTDCCFERLSNFYVLVSDVPFTSTDLTTTLNQAGVSNYYTAGQGGSPTSITVNRTGRYVRVQLSGANYLSMAEVEVLGTPLTNLALGKAATQSSDLYGSIASHAVDGNTTQTMTHTDFNSQAWWQVDLGNVQTIQAIKVYNRTDCCFQYLTSFYVLVSDVPFTSTDLNTTLNQAGVSAYYTAGQGGSPTSIAVNRTGRYVRVQLSGANYLSMAEVEVWGIASDLALGKAATQSSTLYGGASLAVDGNTTSTMTHTNLDNQAWWQVDLGSAQSIQTIKVYNRTDCCFERLSNFYVLVSDVPFTSTDLNTTLNQAGVSAYYTAGQGGSPTSITVNRTGRYVRVQLTGANYLSLSEVEVNGGPSGVGGNIQWLVSDQLGTPRIIADKSGSLAGIRRHDYLPFGEEVGAGVGGRTQNQGYSQPDGVRNRFTGKERDDETGLDYFIARYYSSAQGRFTSPDPLSASGHPNVPQSWNRYSYVLNNPLKLVDPDGMMWIYHYLDDEHKRIGISWIDGNKIPKNLRAQGYQALNFGGASTRDVTLANGSVVRLSAASGHPEVLRGPQQSSRDGGYVNTGLVQEVGRQTAPIPKAVGLFAITGLAGGYTVAGSSILLADAAAYALYAIHEQGENDAQVMASTSNVYQEVTKGGSIRNVQTDVTKSEFIKNLTDAGYKATKAGDVTILDNGANRYVVYDVAKSTGGPSAAFSRAGEGQSLKIRLKP